MIDLNDLRLEVETLEPRNLLDYTTAGVAPAVSNLVTNGTFATAITGWTAGTGWTNTWNAGQFLRATGNGTGTVITWTSVTAAAGQIINGSVDATPGGATPLQNGVETYQAYLIAYNASNVSLGVVAQSQAETWPAGAGNIGWRTLTMTASAPTPANTATVRLEVRKNSSNTGTITVDVDNAVITRESTTVTGWTTSGASVSYQPASWSMAGNVFRLKASGGAAGFFTNSTVMATAPGQYVGASVMAVGNTYARIGIQWLNSSGAQISISYSPYYLLNTNAQRMEFREQAPAGAVRPVFRVYLYSSPQAGNPSWGAYADLDAAVLISVPNATLDDDLSYAYTNDTPNYIINPSGESGGTFGWYESDDANGYLMTNFETEPFEDRQYNFQWRYPNNYSGSLLYLSINSGEVMTPGVQSNLVTMAPGQYVGGTVRVFAKMIWQVRAGWTFLNASGGVISTTWTAFTPTISNVNQASGDSTFIKLPSMVAPALTSRVRMEIEWARTTAQTVNVDEFYYGDWFAFYGAGLMIGASVGEVEGLPSTVAKKYRNLLSPASEISVKKGELEVGILSAFIHDATVDPALDPTMKIGAEVRLRAKVNGVFENVFVGKVQSLKTTYSLQGRPQIELMGVDAIADLVKQQRVQGVSTIPEVGALLANVDVPWMVNGVGQYTGTPTYSYTKDASLLEHITITRDTQKGYAWVDNNGIFRIYDAAKMPTFDSRYTFTDRAKPVSKPQRINLIRNPRGKNLTDIQPLGPTAVANATRGLIVNGPSVAQNNALTGVAWNPPASASSANNGNFNYLTNYAVRMKVTATRACRVQLGHWDYVNSFQSIQPAADLTAGQSVELWGHSPNYSSSEVAFRPFLGIHDTGSNTLLAANTAELLTVEWVIMEAIGTGESDIATGDYFDGDSDWGFWTGLANQSTSVYLTDQWISYTGIDAGWDSQQTVNSILVKVLSGTTETDNGPYINQTSIDAYGYSKTDATIASGPAPATWANGILTAKQAPVVSPGVLRFAATDTASFQKAASIDLYNTVDVEYSNRINGRYKVTSIEHSIRPGKWTTVLTFNNRINSTLW